MSRIHSIAGADAVAVHSGCISTRRRELMTMSLLQRCLTALLLVLAVSALAGCESKCHLVGWDGLYETCDVYWECDDGEFEANCAGADGANCTCVQDGVTTSANGVVGFCAATESLANPEAFSTTKEDAEAEVVDLVNQMCGWSVEPAM